MTNSSIAQRRRSVAASIGVVLIAAALLWIGSRSSARSNSQGVSVASDRAGFVVDPLAWEKPSDPRDAAILSADSARLADCGSDAWEGSMLVLAADGAAYCIHPVDTSDPANAAAARVLAMELQGKELGEDEIDFLRLQILLGYAEEGSAEAVRYRSEMLDRWESLTAVERANIEA